MIRGEHVEAPGGGWVWVRCSPTAPGALAETINGLYKTEVIHRCGPWRSYDAVGMATLERVGRFNNRRLLEPIGNIPPAEAEAHYYAQIEELAMVA